MLYIYIIIIIIVVCRPQGFPGSTPATRPYHLSLSAGIPYYILYQYRTVVDSFWPVALSFLVRVKGFHRSTSLMLSPLLTPAVCSMSCLFNLDGFRDRWQVSILLDVASGFNRTHSILVQLPSSFLSKHLVSVNIVHPYNSIDTTATWKKKCGLFYLIVWLPYN